MTFVNPVEQNIFKAGDEGFNHTMWLAENYAIYAYSPQAKDSAVPANEGKLGDRIEKHVWAEWGSRGVWDFRSVRSNDLHEAMFPIELPKRCIRLLTDPGDIVLDPFMGSGTTALAAIECARHYIGFDKSKSFVNLAQQRIQRVLHQPKLFG